MSHIITRRNAFKVFGTAAFVAASTLAIPQRASAQAAKIRIGGSGRPVPQTYSRATDGYKNAFPPGTEIDYVNVAGGSQIIAALAGNSLDISLVGSPPMVTAFAAGTDISMIYIQETTLKSEGLVVRNASGIKSVKELKGKKVGVMFNTSAHFGILNAMKINGLSNSDVRLLNVKTDAMFALWSRGEIDAAFTWAPHMGKLMADGGTKIFEDGDLVPHGILSFDAIVVRNEFKKRHPELVLAYLQEFNRVSDLFRNDPESVIKPLAEFTKISPEDVRTFVKTYELVEPKEAVSKTWLGRPGELDAGIYKTLKSKGDFMKEVGQLTSVPASYAPFIDSSFAQKLAGG